MIVQVQGQSLRLIRQLDHALASGRMALAWIPSVPFANAFAIALHDFAWADEDREPVWDEATQSPVSFQTIGSQRRALLYAAGVGRLAAIDGLAAALATLHYSRFVPDAKELAPSAGASSHSRSVALLRHLDDLSLFVCLAGPDSEARPDWLSDERVQARPDGPTHRLRWCAADELSLDPFPFDRPLELRIPCRDLPRTPYPTGVSLRDAWEKATPAEHNVRLVPG